MASLGESPPNRIRATLSSSAPLRFLIGGAVNTIATLVAYWLLLTVTSYPIAYTVSFVAGVFTGFAINTVFVFRVPWAFRKLLAFPLIHGVNYLCGMIVVAVSVHVLGIDAWLAPLVAIAVTLPINYLMTKFVIAGKSAKQAGG